MIDAAKSPISQMRNELLLQLYALQPSVKHRMLNARILQPDYVLRRRVGYNARQAVVADDVYGDQASRGHPPGPSRIVARGSKDWTVSPCNVAHAAMKRRRLTTGALSEKSGPGLDREGHSTVYELTCNAYVCECQVSLYEGGSWFM